MGNNISKDFLYKEASNVGPRRLAGWRVSMLQVWIPHHARLQGEEEEGENLHPTDTNKHGDSYLSAH